MWRSYLYEPCHTCRHRTAGEVDGLCRTGLTALAAHQQLAVEAGNEPNLRPPGFPQRAHELSNNQARRLLALLVLMQVQPPLPALVLDAERSGSSLTTYSELGNLEK